MANASTPRRRIAPIPVLVSAAATGPSAPDVETDAAAATKQLQAPEALTMAPGRRLHVDLTKTNTVSFRELVKQSMATAAAAKAQAAAAPSRSEQPRAADDPHGRRSNIYTDVIRNLELRCMAGELSGSSDIDDEGESGDATGDDDGESEASDDAAPGDEGTGRDTALSSGAEEEGREGEEADASSEATDTDSGADRTVAEDTDTAAGAGEADRGTDKPPAADGVGPSKAAGLAGKPPKARMSRNVRYEHDFIDDSDVLRKQRGGVRTLVEGFFINQGVVDTVMEPGAVQAAAARKAQQPARTVTPTPADSAPSQQPIAAEAQAKPGAAGKGKRARDESSDAGPSVPKPKAKQRRTASAQTAGRADAQVDDGSAPEASARQQAQPSGPVKQSLAQLAAQAGNKAVSKAGSPIPASGPLRNVQNQQPAPDPQPGGAADKAAKAAAGANKQTVKPQPSPAAGSLAAAGKAAASGDLDAQGKAAAGRQRGRQTVSKTLDKLKAKLQAVLAPADGAAFKPLKLHALRSQLMNIALTCLYEVMGVGGGRALPAGRLACADETAWRAELRGYATEMLSEGRSAALTGQDADSVAAEMARLASDQLSEIHRHVDSACDHIKRAQHSSGNSDTEVLGPDVCAALHKAVESARKVLPAGDARDWVMRTVQAAQLRAAGTHVFSVECMDTELSAYTSHLKTTGRSTGLGVLSQAAEEEPAVEEAGTGKPTLTSPLPRVKPAKSKGRDKDRASDQATQPIPATQQVLVADKVEVVEEPSLAATQGSAGYKIELNAEEEGRLLQLARTACERHGADLTLLAQDWEQTPHSHGKAILTAFVIHGPGGATVRQAHETIRDQALIPGWAATKACHGRVTHVLKHKVMRSLIQPIQAPVSHKYAWHHLPGITIVPRKVKAGGTGGKGDSGNEEEGQ